MASFYQLSDADRAQCLTELARAALTRWDGRFGDPKLFKNRENAVFSVEREDGTRVALRIHRAAYHSDSALRSELYWMAELARSGIPVPPVIPASDGSLFVHAQASGIPEIRQVDMLGWLSTSPAAVPGVGDPHYYQVGQLAARLHEQGARIALPDGFARHSWDEAGLIGQDPLWGRFWDLPALSADQRALVLAARESALPALAAFGKSDARYGMIHGDLIRDNILEDDGRLQAIDFDDCGFGWYMFELATILLSIFDEDDYPLLRDQLVRGYRSIRPLPDADLDRLPLFLFLRASTYLGWLQTRSETQNARERGAALIDRCCRVASDYLKLESLSQRDANS